MPWAGIAAAVFLVDFITKFYIENNFYLGESLPITPFFNLVLAHNTGAAFSFLAGHSGWQMYLFSIIAAVAVFICARLIIRHSSATLFCLSLAFIMGGALGNLFDRIIYGYVIDFLDFYYEHWHWPAFNVADMAIVCGAALLIIDSFFNQEH